MNDSFGVLHGVLEVETLLYHSITVNGSTVKLLLGTSHTCQWYGPCVMNTRLTIDTVNVIPLIYQTSHVLSPTDLTLQPCGWFPSIFQGEL